MKWTSKRGAVLLTPWAVWMSERSNKRGESRFGPAVCLSKQFSRKMCYCEASAGAYGAASLFLVLLSLRCKLSVREYIAGTSRNSQSLFLPPHRGGHSVANGRSRRYRVESFSANSYKFSWFSPTPSHSCDAHYVLPKRGHLHAWH